MKYQDDSVEQLKKRIEELEALNRTFLQEKEQETRLEFAWSGNLGQWYWYIPTNSVTFNPLKLSTLGYDLSEIPTPVDYQFFVEKLHPDDYEKTMESMRNHLQGKNPVYEVEYRIRAKDGSYKWYYDRGKITQYDESGKPIFLSGIVFDITHRKEMQVDLEQKNRLLEEMSALDSLTRIGNHRALMTQLKSEISEISRTSMPLSIVIFDIDDFKKINDTKGHIFGDQVLIEVAMLIQKNIRNYDHAGRYGGEEFMVIFPNTEAGKAGKVSERIRKAVEKHEFIDGSKVTISGGVQQHLGESATDFINAADLKLYTAKRQGKNQIVI
jgi:diguanylate cyclase (GGDEF)-like protein/PAS domain S-box-containing protein